MTSAAAASGFALGVSPGWQQRKDYGHQLRQNFVPELVGLAYLGTDNRRVFIRPGLRLSYSGLEQAPMPMAVQVSEHDFGVSGELGVLYDGTVVPAVAAGGRVMLRRINLATSPPVSAPDAMLDRSELLPSFFLQAGVGIPFARGFFLFEPYARYEQVYRDPRSRWRFGIDLTVEL